MPPDFSHYSNPPLYWLETLIERGHRLPNESFVRALKNMEPPLLPADEVAGIIEFLTPLRESRQGAKAKGLSRVDLVNKLRRTVRGDIPRRFLEAICDRLEEPGEKPAAVLERALSRQRTHRRSQRNTLIRAIYPIMLELVRTSGPWEHKLLGRVDAPPGLKGASGEMALVMTAHYLRSIGHQPPGPRTMRNILSERSRIS